VAKGVRVAYRPDMMELYRSPMARLTGKQEAGLFLLQISQQEKPTMSQVAVDEENQVEHWWVEKQFWLKYRQHFTNFGYLPQQKINTNTGRQHMLEKY